MKICVISKYPPIEGGVSSETYWMCKALGERGHEVFVVTNAWEVERDYREQIKKDELPLLEPKNVTVFSTVNDFRSPILKSDYYGEKLMNLAVDVIRSKKVDLVYSHYILPYGIAGFVSKTITNKPSILRHAGSDIGRLYWSRFLKTIFLEALKSADKVIGGKNIYKIFEKHNMDTSKISRVSWSPNPEYFNPHIKPFDLSPYVKDADMPIFSYFGKVSELKKTYAFADAASKIKDKKFMLLFIIGDGDEAQKFKKYVSSLGLRDKCVFLPFQPPWKIPSIMKASTCVVSPESEEAPVLKKGSHYPKVVHEAMACGKFAIMGEGVSKKGAYAQLVNNENILIVNPHNVNEFKEKLEYVIDNPSVIEKVSKNAYEFSKGFENFDDYISCVESLICSVANNS